MTKETGGPAFPAIMEDQYGSKFANEGMTLRDYFAAKAMQGFAANLGPGATFETRASIAYQWADEMLKARKA
jgi:hypothetical protein